MRVTEQSHELTERIDEASIADIIDQIAQADSQVFGSPAWGAGLLDPILLRNLRELQESISDVLEHPAGRVIISGAGTSGRLAMQAAATCELTGAERVLGVLAGGPEAFFKARERVEDQPSSGAKDLKELLKQGGPFVFVGITCGLSAPYVAGQVQTALIANAESTVVIGFNRVHHADKRIHPGLVRPFVDILADLERARHGALLNPIIGPEPIAGSTRMKGGTATRIILDCLLNAQEPEALIKQYKTFQSRIYRDARRLEPIIEKAGAALLGGGSLVYVAAAREGLMAMLDASECPPTFGASGDQVKAFVDDGFWNYLPEFETPGHRLDDFRASPGDLVIIAGSSERVEQCVAQCQVEGIEVVRIEFEEALYEGVPPTMKANFGDLALKWALNLISTGAFIQYGKIYGNRMIDLRISNLKLWERACRIVSEIAGIDVEEAETILRNIVVGDQENVYFSDLISKAVVMERVVATAVLIARGKSPEEATTLARQTPKLKDCLRDLE